MLSKNDLIEYFFKSLIILILELGFLINPIPIKAYSQIFLKFCNSLSDPK